jgi:hypothetical protein
MALTAAALLVGLCGVVRAQPGVTVKDGKLYRDGKVYRGIGVNYCDLFQELIADGTNQRTLNGLRFLGDKGIPFVRFWACGFWPSDWDLYLADTEEWFRRMDLVVKTAEETGVGLIPDLLWTIQTPPQLVGEFQDQWGNPGSKTHAFMRQYVQEVVTRYKDSPTIWGWEFTNELNLHCDLPNGMEFLGQSIPHLKYNVAKDTRNLWTHEMAGVAYAAFADEVRKHDTYRFITTGNSCPRTCAYHIGKKLPEIWGDDDREQAFEAFVWYAPAALDVVSVHSYGDAPEKLMYAGQQGIGPTIAVAKEFATRLGKPLFVGEFAGLGPEELEPKFKDYQTEYLESFLSSKVDLAAYWVFDYTADRKGMGLVRQDNEWAWVIEQIVEYNRKVAQQLEEEAR